MNVLYRVWAIVVIAVKRLLARRWLALALLLGLVTAIALTMSIPLYADAVYFEVLQKEVRESHANASALNRPPFAYLFRYSGATYGATDWEDLAPLDGYLAGPASAQLGLPHRATVRFVKTDNARLFPQDETAYSSRRDPLEWVAFGFLSGYEEMVEVLEGSLPAASTGEEGPIEVLVHRQMADELGLQAGELYTTFRQTETDLGTRTVQLPIRISGIWDAADPSSELWFYRPDALQTTLLVPEQSYVSRVAPVYPQDVYQALWYLVMDGSQITTADVGRLLGNARAVEQQAANLLPNTRLDVSPVDALRRYRSASGLLTILLYAFSIPIVALLLAFIVLVVGLAVARQRNELAVLRSRGATTAQLLGVATVEALLLGVLALLLAIPISYAIAQLIGATRGFLNFTFDAELRVTLTRSALQFGGLALLVTLLAQIVPTIGAARHSIVTYKWEQARTVRPPWWQRTWLDVLLLLPFLYGIYLLRQQGSISLPGRSGSDTLLNNPIFFLLPALGLFALSLLALRILPLLMAALAWVAAKANWVGMLLASRHLWRNRGLYTAPLLLLILTLSLSVFTTSLARTLDDHLYDRAYYRVGADALLREMGEAPPDDAEGAEVTWHFVPVSEHLRVPAIQAATRIGEYSARVQLQGDWRSAQLVGIDRVDYPRVAYWRPDFAAASLGALMNALAVAPNGVLLSQDLTRQHAIEVGDSIQVQITRYNITADTTMHVVGTIRYFPGWYPEDGPLLVGNLDYIFAQLGGQFPYDVLVRTAPETDFEQLRSDLRALDLHVLSYDSARQRIAAEQRLPERQGLFGVLSVGFLAAALLTVIGFLLYTLFSFQRRFVELGTLRAIGLSGGQMTAFLTWELLFLIGAGLGIGTGLGALTSQIFIPYLQVGNRPADLTPPFLVGIAWPAIGRVYLLFGLLFVAGLVVLVYLLRRMRIFQAVKMGEAV